MGIANWLGYEKIEKNAEIGGRFVLPFQSGKPYIKPTQLKQFINRYASWVYACANRNAINSAQVPLNLFVAKPAGTTGNSRFKTVKPNKETINYLSNSPTTRQIVARATDVEQLLEHPFIELIQNVNEFMNGFELFEITYLYLELTGNAYWFIERDNLGRPIELWPLMPQYMKPVLHKQKFVIGYEFSIDNVNKFFYEFDEIIHYKYPNPKDPFIGMGKLEACIVAADLYGEMNTYETALLQNSGRPDMALILPENAGSPSDDELKRMRRDWYRRHGGSKKTGNLAILSGGAKLESMTFKPKEMNFLKGRDTTLQEIAGVFGVPMSKLVTKDVNRANAETGNYTYSKDTILPMLRRVEQKINEQLMPMFDENLFVSYENPVPQDKEFELKERESNITTGYTTINEERAKNGLDPVAWGDEPLNKAPAATIPVEPVKTAVTKAEEPLRQPSDEMNPVFAGAVAKFFRDIKKEVLRLYDKYPPDVKNVKAKKPVGGVPTDWFDMIKWNKNLAEIEVPFIRATYLLGGRAAMKQLKTELQFNSITAGIGNVVDRRTGAIVTVNNTTLKAIRAEVGKGIEAGESVTKIRKRLTGYFDGDDIRQRTELIARTETNWAYNEGAVDGYIQSGVVKAKEWLTAQDDRLCEFCEPMNGKIVGIDESWFKTGEEFEGNEGGKLSFSYEDVGHPPLHPRCRCSIIPVLKDIE